jgi:hypothetical protein
MYVNYGNINTIVCTSLRVSADICEETTISAVGCYIVWEKLARNTAHEASKHDRKVHLSIAASRQSMILANIVHSNGRTVKDPAVDLQTCRWRRSCANHEF